MLSFEKVAGVLFHESLGNGVEFILSFFRLEKLGFMFVVKH